MREKRQNESALVIAAQRGDKEAIHLLLKHNWKWVKGLVYSIVHNIDDFDDVLQDICVRVISKIDTLRQPERFRSWLAVLARRQALQYRRQRNRRFISLEDAFADDVYDEKTPRFLENLEKEEQYRQILEAVKSLPEKYSEVFVLGHIEGLTYQKIAEILDLPITTIQVRLVRARRMIYKEITGKDKVREN